MTPGMIEHRGVVQRVEGNKAIVVMETGGCSSCGQEVAVASARWPAAAPPPC